MPGGHSRSLASFISLPHFAISRLIVAANSSGVPATTSRPMPKSLSRISLRLSMRRISWVRRLTAGAGVPGGTRKPDNETDS